MLPLNPEELTRALTFTQHMDSRTRLAMIGLFQHTKPGCGEGAYDLMDVAHELVPAANMETIAQYSPWDIVNADGKMPMPVKLAIRRVVSESYLLMRTAPAPILHPEFILG